MIKIKFVLLTDIYSRENPLQDKCSRCQGKQMVQECVYEASIRQGERRSARFDLRLMKLLVLIFQTREE